ncbi:hypothetical protein LX99_05072 [Mucilaginibacter oryzae]|uniref:Uncharacterized protein n=1 Tax=Mucilaginibacter oryzae TaxID=468058 RepID=A0A316GVY0_9SPHI|nr:hypothetical protein [Mucilaginibacter oryzae]PWK64668.1 hypothetical protein LX99_05072 [Mucilaginibacter oryzae]
MPTIDLSTIQTIEPIAAPEVEDVTGISTVSLVGVPKDTPRPAPLGKPLSGIEEAGVNLAKITFRIILAFILFLVVYLFVKDLDATEAVKSLPTPKDEKLVAALIAEKKAHRDFLLETCKVILLNLLLPILTAILGYIFGSSKSDKA